MIELGKAAVELAASPFATKGAARLCASGMAPIAWQGPRVGPLRRAGSGAAGGYPLNGNGRSWAFMVRCAAASPVRSG
jgi:hypothetical protein